LDRGVKEKNMALILDGTNGLSDVDGSAATPAIRGSDANTGVFFGTDIVGVSTGGTERVRVDASGNVGIGTSSPAHKLHVVGNAFVPLTNSFYCYTTDYGIGTPDSGGLQMFSGSSDSIRFGKRASGTFTENARIDSSGNLQVGTTSGGGRIRALQPSNVVSIYAGCSRASAGSEEIYRSEFTAVSPNNTSSWFFYANDTSSERFSVRSNGGIANFSGNNVNLSDRREKTNFAPAGEYLSKICAIPVQTFNYIDQNHEEDPGLTLGVVAQDVQEVAPELVMESNWGTKEEPKMRLSIYQTDLQYALMKCIQEQQAIITALTARVEALEGAQA